MTGVQTCALPIFVNYPVKKDEFVEISYENLLEWCEEIEMVCCVGNDK